MEHFFPQIQVKTKKKVFIKNRTLFSPNLHAQMYTNSNYWGDADVDHSQTIGGDTAKLLGDISPLVSAPLASSVPGYLNLFAPSRPNFNLFAKGKNNRCFCPEWFRTHTRTNQ